MCSASANWFLTWTFCNQNFFLVLVLLQERLWGSKIHKERSSATIQCQKDDLWGMKWAKHTNMWAPRLWMWANCQLHQIILKLLNHVLSHKGKVQNESVIQVRVYEKHMHAVRYNYTLSLNIRASSTVCVFTACMTWFLFLSSNNPPTPRPPVWMLDTGVLGVM